MKKVLWTQVADVLEEKKAKDIAVFDIRKKSSFSDYIIICTGMSDRQVKALAEQVIEAVGKPFGREGVDEGRWVLLDYLDVIVHIMQDDVRKYYDLDGMWLGAKRLRE